MKPRGFWRIFFTVAAGTGGFVLLTLLLVYLASGIDLVYLLRWSIWSGIVFVLLSGFGAGHTMKAVMVSITFQDKKAFLSKLNVVLAEMGYHPESQTESFLTYKPSFQVGLLSGKISVQIDDNSSTIVGPNTYVKKLQKWLQQ